MKLSSLNFFIVASFLLLIVSPVQAQKLEEVRSNETPSIKQMRLIIEDYTKIVELDEHKTPTSLAKYYQPFFGTLLKVFGIRSVPALYFTTLSLYSARYFERKHFVWLSLLGVIRISFLKDFNFDSSRLIKTESKRELSIEKAKFSIDRAQINLKAAENLLDKACALKHANNNCNSEEKENLLLMQSSSSLGKVYGLFSNLIDIAGIEHESLCIMRALGLHIGLRVGNEYRASAHYKFILPSSLLLSSILAPNYYNFLKTKLDEFDRGGLSLEAARIRLAKARDYYQAAQDALEVIA